MSQYEIYKIAYLVSKGWKNDNGFLYPWFLTEEDKEFENRGLEKKRYTLNQAFERQTDFYD